MSSLCYSGPSLFFRELAEFPVPTSAKFTDATSLSKVVSVSYLVRDDERNVNRSIAKIFTLDGLGSVIGGRPIPPAVSLDSPEILAILYATSGKRYALLRQTSDTSGGKKRYVEVWSGAQLEASVEVTKLHGPFRTEVYFKSFSFTPSETALVYTAEANPPNEEDDPFLKFRFAPDFGEELYTVKRPTLFVFRWRSPNEESAGDSDTKPAASVTALSLHPSPILPVAFGQATFVSETRLYATGYESSADGRISGLKGCFNRPTSILELSLPSETLGTSAAAITSVQHGKIQAPGHSYRSARVLFDKDGGATTIFWLSNSQRGARVATVTLHCRDLKLGMESDRVLVDIVYDPSPDEFPGLCDFSLADSPFLRLGDKTYILTHILWRSRPTLVSIDVQSGAVVHVTPDEHLDGPRLYSWNLLATDGGRLAVCARSTPTSPYKTVLLTFKDGVLSPLITVLDTPSISPKLQEALSCLEARLVTVPNRHPLESVVIRAKKLAQGPKPVCMTFLHGGPHTSSTTSFTPGMLAYALEGYTVSLPNYAGSLGFGEMYIQKNIGKCGTIEVADVMASVEELIRLGFAEPGRLVIHGGSYGGFTTAHVISQHPDVFSAAALRNPVIAPQEFTASDIPDWPFSEFGIPYGPGQFVTPDDFAKFYAASPMAFVDRVKTPTLLLLGLADLRAPVAGGKGYYHALKGRGKVTDILTFPGETHWFDGVEASRVVYEASRDWFRKFVD